MISFVPANIMDGSSRKEYKKTSEVLRIIWCVYPGSDYMNRIDLRQNEIGSTLFDLWGLNSLMRIKGWHFSGMLGVVFFDTITRHREVFYESRSTSI